MVEEHVCQVRVDLDLRDNILVKVFQPPSAVTSAHQAILQHQDGNQIADDL